jgi:uroporphyrin-III C-methyltransferase/precorrin-2 dehydrogenase/sirohydrochlorin ferrochelatase
VLVVGGGQVAQRRVPGLLAAGADVVVVSPEVTPAIEGQVLAGEVTWVARGFVEADLDDTWYVIAATDDRGVNEQISKSCEDARIFCVRSDDGTSATAWTPASCSGTFRPRPRSSTWPSSRAAAQHGRTRSTG